MCREAKNECIDEGGKTGFGCCPEEFHEMPSKMSGRCEDKGNLLYYAEIMSRMESGCCGSESTSKSK